MPPQRAIVIAWAAGVVTVGVTSVAYLVLLAGFGRVHDPFRVVAAYATAWTAGFIAVPIPSGLGVRESILAGIMPSGFPSSVIVAASVYHRLAAIATEGVMAAIASHRLRPARTAALRAAELSMDTDADGVGD